MKRYQACLLLLSLIGLLSSQPTQLLVLADIHLDLFYKPDAAASGYCKDPSQKAESEAPLGRYGCDSPLDLLVQVLEHASKTVDPKYVLINGDIVAHAVSWERGKGAVLETHEVVFDLVAYYFPQAIILPSIGNNDLFVHNNVPKRNQIQGYYPILYSIWFGEYSVALKNRNFLSLENQRNFKRGGFYSVQIADNLTLLVINSIFYKIENLKTNDPQGAQKQFEWIERTLSSATEGMKFIPFYHVNIGTNLYGNYTWHQEYENRFLKLQRKYGDRIMMDWVAHIHHSTFRGYQDAFTGRLFGFALHSPAVTPNSHTNPSFRVYTLETVNRATTIQGYRDYAFQLEQATALNKLNGLQGENSNLVWETQFTNQLLGIKEFTAEAIGQYWYLTIDNPSKFDIFLLQSGGYDQSQLELVKQQYTSDFGVQFPTSIEKNLRFYCRMMCPGRKNYAQCHNLHPLKN